MVHISDIVLQAFPAARAIHTCLGVLLVVCAFLKLVYAYRYNIRVHQAAKGVTGSEDTVVDLLESIEHFLKRLDIYTKIPPTPAMDEMVMKIVVEVLSILAVATRELKEGRPSEWALARPWYLTHCNAEKFVKTLFGGENDAEAVLQRLGRLTQEEARTTAAKILEVVYGLVQDMSEQIHSTRLPLADEYSFF